MSCDWNVHCLDCDDTHEFNDANHRVELMRALAKLGPEIALAAAVVEKIRAVSNDDFEFRFAFGCLDTAWWREHGAHRLIARDEYGHNDGECGQYFACRHCKATHFCRLPCGHEGDHDQNRPIDADRNAVPR